jgi:hypothetical protein
MSLRSITVPIILAALAALIVLAPAPRVDGQRSAAATTVDWALHNLDLAGRRYSTLDQINPSNVKTLRSMPMIGRDWNGWSAIVRVRRSRWSDSNLLPMPAPRAHLVRYSGV